jgi:hypothetical protein
MATEMVLRYAVESIGRHRSYRVWYATGNFRVRELLVIPVCCYFLLWLSQVD